ncbi:MAG: GAF domain-containing sensor histidine kinase [Verrucomicrobiota bacterium]
MTVASDPTETLRMQALRRYDILDTPPDGNFDSITALAARLLKVPIALTTLVDTDRIWFKSRHGLEVEQIDRVPGLCASAILQGTPYVVEDARFDPRTLANPLVAGEFGLRFYAAVPLTTQDHHRLGTLCVIDQEPRQLSQDEIGILQTLASLVMDQMELRLASRRVDAQNVELRELNREKDHFLAMAVHDLRTPLATSVLFGELLAEQNVGPLNPQQAEMVSGICSSSKFIMDQINDFLEFSSLGTGRIQLKREITDLPAIVGHTLSDHELRAKEKGVPIELLEPPALPPISLDPMGIRRALGNLIGNAVKFSNPGESIRISLSHEGSAVRIDVADQGPGIAPEEISQLFEPYSTSSARPTRGEKGTGLGLAIARRIVEAHGGQIGVTSEPGRGSTFFIRIPLES